MFEGKSILTIDDSDTIRSYLKNLLAPRGSHVEGAATGQEGLLKCEQFNYDLILLDLILPDKDGIEVLQGIRAKNTTSTVVMITGHGGIKSAIAATQLGADGYLQKQDITATDRDHSEFLYALEQAMERRAGLVAQKQLETMRADFYTMVTHDIRNPACTLQATLEMLSDDYAGALTESQQELLSIANHAVGKMLHLINNYLDYAKIDAGYLRLDIGSVDLVSVVKESVQFSALQARTKQQVLMVDLPDVPVWAFADAERLKQVLDNLLSNACKYTPENGEITLQLRVEGEQAVFRVTDTGMGISADQIVGLFTKYHRVPGEATRSIMGTGLGLLIVKEIVGAHGGSISAESAGIGQGTSFIFNIPLGYTANTPPFIEDTPVPVSAAETSLQTETDMGDTEIYQTFIQETREQIHSLQDILRKLKKNAGHDHKNLVEAAQRLTHLIKGNAGALQFTAIYHLATQMDEMLRKALNGDLIITGESRTDLASLLDQIIEKIASQPI